MRKSLLLILIPLLLGGCKNTAWQTKDISGLMPPLAFTLTDENGQRVHAADYRGKPTLLFFGYTHCPDVCPTTLARLAAVSQQLDEGARKELQVLFVSVDPARDDAASLQRYTDAFGPQFIGLSGDSADLAALTRRYRVTFGYGEKDTDGNYSVSHSGAVFGFDRAGDAQLLIRDSDSAAAVTADLRRLTAGS